MTRRLLALACLMLLVACEGPPGAATQPSVVEGVDLSDPDVGGGIGLPEEALDGLPAATAELPPATLEASPRLSDDEVANPTAVPPTPTEEPPPPQAIESPAPEPTVTVMTEPASEPIVEEDEAADTEPVAEESTAEVEVRPESHIVASGETLNQIAQLYGLTWPDLATFNGLANADQIQAGLELQIPPLEDAAEEVDEAAAELEVTPPDETPDEGAPEDGTADEPAVEEPTRSPQTETTHTIQPGENLFRISSSYGVDWVLVAEANGLSAPNQIFVGQVLKIPVTVPGPTPEFTHEVHAGETVFRIALQYGIPLAALVETNGLQAPYVIYPGQNLQIPLQ